jgi:hypothetical protein
MLPVRAESTGGKVDFSRDIRPILSEYCFHCHGPDEKHREAKLRLDLKEDAFADRDGVPALVAGDLDASEVWYRIITGEEDELMPPPESKKELSASQKELIRKWIEQGAPWEEHWAFAAPGKPSVPDGVNPIDHFVGERLEREGLTFSEQADARTLFRRLNLDLSGLPPSADELRRLADSGRDPDIDAEIDRLLASPHFGERMAVMWLDAARYGDTSVMHADGPRDMWPWRDWVVRAYNRNKPFDEFGIEQLAGDLMPDATLDQRVATGFNRNHATSDEGGAIPEELRVEYVVDRVRTTSNVFMGLTMECAQCHDHKYDPISQREYYRFFAYFNNHADPGMQTRRGNQAPVVHVTTEEDHERLGVVREQIRQSEARRQKLRKEAAPALKEWLKPSGGEAYPQPGGLKHFLALDGGKRDIVVDHVSAKVGGFEGPQAGSDMEDAEERGISFDGKSAVTFPDFPDYDLKQKPFTISAWLKVPKEVTGAACSDMDVGNKHRGWDLWLQKNRVGTHIISSWPGNALKVVSKEALTPDTWHHVVVTYDGKAKAEGVGIYIDGRKAENVVEVDKLKGSTKSDAPFRIGARSSTSYFRGTIDDIRIYNRALREREIGRAAQDPIEAARATAGKDRSPEQKKLLTEYFHTTVDEDCREVLASLSSLRLEEQLLIKGKTTSMVMADNPPEQMRITHILDRGAYDSPRKDEEVAPGVPAVLPPVDSSAPANRLTLARWLFSDEHPLTARVAVNMIWQVFFGAGLVETPGDFGAQGAYPSHPELLDWLAVDFRENGWDVKRLVRQIVTSRTYQQPSRMNPQHKARDPQNRLLARASRFRLNAEFVRDNALAVSGLLNDEIGGPGVKPYQPPGLWAQVGLGGNPKFVEDKGEKLYRRSLYTYFKRSAPPPGLQIFDAPTRETCTMKRPRTNTPLQALVTLNDTQFVEAARMLAERMMKEGGESPAARNAYGFELATARLPDGEEMQAMREVYRDALATYRADPGRAAELLAVGESPRDESLAVIQHAATTIVASLVLNLDETLTRE